MPTHRRTPRSGAQCVRPGDHAQRLPTTLVHRVQRIQSVTKIASSLAVILALGLASSRADADPDRVVWSPDWPRARWWEVVDVVALTAASDAIDTDWRPPRDADWKGGILFDDWARGVFRGRTAAVQSFASNLGDTLYEGSVLAPYVIDNYVFALVVHRNLDVAVQLTLIDMQSLGMAGVITLGAEHTIARERPYAHDCGPDGQVHDGSGRTSESCTQADDFKSFYSGHAAASAAMAGLTCVHHQHLPLYGGGAADVAPCVLMIGISIVTGMTRLVADRHWASDVIVGWGVGAAAGYLVPSALHYGFGSGRPVGALRVGSAVMVPVPEVYPGGGGLGVGGVF
jgi:membrane-associated phospholipid phosphatase